MGRGRHARRFSIILMALLGGAVESMAASSDLTSLETPLYSSSAALGFGVEQQSSTGFGGIGGSLFFLDLARAMGDGLSVGWRTAGMGGKNDGCTFQRMTTGPLVDWRVNADWRITGSLGYFKESARTTHDDVYTSSGTSTLVEWERVVSMTRFAELSVGGFWAFYSGTFSTAAELTPSQSRRFNDVQRNVGQTRGVIVSLRMPLR